MHVHLLGPGDEELLIRAVRMIGEAELSALQAQNHLDDQALVAVAAVEHGEPVGFVYGYVLRRFEHTDVLIYSVDVAEAYRRRGVGRAMMERLHALKDQRGWAGMWVLTNRSNPAAMRLYESAGGIIPLPDDVVMFDFYD